MLINCVAYHQGKKLADISIEDISIWVQKPECFVWVALRDATHAELQQMQEEFGLHELAVEDARNGHQRPKMEEYGGIVFIVMQLLEIQQEQEQVQVGEVAIFVGTNFVLSVRNNSQQNFLGVRGRCEREPHLLQHGSSFVCYALMDAVVDRYFPLLDAIETELDDIESRIFERNAGRGNIERLYALKHRATTMRHAVSPLLEVTGKLHGGRVPVVFSGTQEYFRDVHDHLMRINSTIDSIRETIATAIQVNLSMVTIEESETTKKLAAWAAIFAVSTALAGIWGMNFENMPELKWEYGYPAALFIIFSAASVLYWRFRRIGWL
ncbi:magnesium/cobalt transporter CorA [Giesbergeria anulus]|uniref:Magnesium transport protein CorA n=1 Tax=Giesbergeria anulus TaxID=180197 RepID=A0A1H9PAX5_9BURK|nr:magnesium/cobalt transporter CorA [Giesbergeria anulus]SER45291.1 magnesium transporter [Giesbergeria anulus]